MAISDFPLALQPIIQQNMLAREFIDGLAPSFTFRRIAERETFETGIGETITKTKKGLKAPVTTPLNPANNTGLDNGLTPSGWTVEQYTLALNSYGDTIDLNTFTQQVGIANQFLANARTNGVQSAESVDWLARNALYGAYLSGNTTVTATLGADGTVVHVDDVTGFTWAYSNGKQVPVSNSNPLAVTVNGTAYNVIGYSIDGSNTNALSASNPGQTLGQSGTLTFATNVAVADGTAGNSVSATVAPLVVRSGGRASTAALTVNDFITAADIRAAVTQLKNNRVPKAEGGVYICYLDPTQMAGLFKDEEFQRLYRGAYNSDTYISGQVTRLLDVEFVETTAAPQQKLGSVHIHRAIVCGQGALIEGVFAGIGKTGDAPGVDPEQITVQDGIAHITREPLDRLKQIVSQSWLYAGGFCVPTDITANQAIIPTASKSAFKRAVVIESGAAN